MVTEFLSATPPAAFPLVEPVLLAIGPDALVAGAAIVLSVGVAVLARRRGARRDASLPSLRLLTNARRATIRRAA
jgi:hypothetical protein